MDGDSYTGQEQGRKTASRGPIRAFLAHFNPFSSYWRDYGRAKQARQAAARESAEVEAGRPRDDYMMTSGLVVEGERRGTRLMRWLFPSMVVVIGLTEAKRFVGHPFVLIVMGLEFAVIVTILVLAVQSYNSICSFRDAFSTSGDSDFNRALGRFAEGNAESAVRLMKSAIADKPNTMAGRMFLVDMYCHLGRHEAALLVAQEAVEMFPRHPWPRQRLGQVYAAQRKSDEAIKEYENAANLAGAAEGLHGYGDEALKAIEEIKKLRHP